MIRGYHYFRKHPFEWISLPHPSIRQPGLQVFSSTRCRDGFELTAQSESESGLVHQEAEEQKNTPGRVRKVMNLNMFLGGKKLRRRIMMFFVFVGVCWRIHMSVCHFKAYALSKKAFVLIRIPKKGLLTVTQETKFPQSLVGPARCWPCWKIAPASKCGFPGWWHAFC